MAVTYCVVITRAYIAARAIATARITTKVEDSTIFICDSGRSAFAGTRIAQNLASLEVWPPRRSPQARPIVRNENRIDRIRRIVLDAGGLTSDKPLEAHLAFESGNILAGLIRHSGNRIAVRNDMPQMSGKWTRLRTEKPLRRRSFFSWMPGQLDDLTFCDTSNLIQVQTPLAFGFFQVNRRPKESVENDANTGDDCQGESKYSFRDGKQISQRADSHATVKLHILSELLGACGIRLPPDAPDWSR